MLSRHLRTTHTRSVWASFAVRRRFDIAVLDHTWGELLSMIGQSRMIKRDGVLLPQDVVARGGIRTGERHAR
jgi:hypothetical protein